MKYFISLFIFLIPDIFAQDCKAMVQILTDNELAFVIVNDSLGAEGKFMEFELVSGTYAITIGERSDRWDAKTFYDTIIVTGCEKIQRAYKFFGKTHVDSEPQDAYVFTADTLIGHTPLLLPSNINEITLKKPGYEEKKIAVNYTGENVKIQLYPIPFEQDDNFFESPLFLYMSGSLVVFGALSAYFKLQADDKYSEYQVTGNESLLSETRRLDTISGIGFAAVQINFGLLIYYFLTD